eukprot:766377-Hanusia_phi.AAC.4
MKSLHAFSLVFLSGFTLLSVTEALRGPSTFAFSPSLLTPRRPHALASSPVQGRKRLTLLRDAKDGKKFENLNDRANKLSEEAKKVGNRSRGGFSVIVQTGWEWRREQSGSGRVRDRSKDGANALTRVLQGLQEDVTAFKSKLEEAQKKAGERKGKGFLTAGAAAIMVGLAAWAFGPRR